MRNVTDWNLLLSENNSVDVMIDFGFNNRSVNSVSEDLAGSVVAGEFRNLVRSHGTQYARRLARKALRRRDLVVELV